MSFFKKLKRDIGFEEEEKKSKEKEDQKRKIIGKKEEASVQKPDKEEKDWPEVEGQLAVDVYQTKSSFIIQAPVAGIKPEDLDISVEDGILVVRGKREKIEEIQEKDYFYQECYWGAFSRKVSLPEDVDSSKVKASLKKGVLTIELPRIIKKEKKKKIIIEEKE
jgi:HSP20 family protein